MVTDRAFLASLPSDVQATAKAEWPFQVGLIYLADIIIDDSYQRPPQEKFVADITDHFDPTLVGVIDLSDRGSVFAALDGQQRYLAMQNRGFLTCWGAVYTGMSIADEAGFFYRKNKDRRNMPLYYAFRARVVAGDTEAIEILNAVEMAGFSLGQSTNERDVIGAISAVETTFGYKSDDRLECLTPALRTIQAAFFGRKQSLDASILTGLGRFWSRFNDEDVDFDRLHSQLGISGPNSILGIARDRYNLHANHKTRPAMSWTVARLIGETYNAQLERKLRLDLKRLGVG